MHHFFVCHWLFVGCPTEYSFKLHQNCKLIQSQNARTPSTDIYSKFVDIWRFLPFFQKLWEVYLCAHLSDFLLFFIQNMTVLTIYYFWRSSWCTMHISGASWNQQHCRTSSIKGIEMYQKRAWPFISNHNVTGHQPPSNPVRNPTR